MAHKKAGGSVTNGRDSQAKRLGFKAFAGNFVPAGSILVRQRGTRAKAGAHVGVGKDHTLFSLIDGYVKFEQATRERKRASVYPVRGGQ